MTEDIDRTLDEWFELALDIPVEDLATWLDALGQRDPALRARLERLLQADAGAGDFLETPLPVALTGSDADDAQIMPQSFGVYRVLRVLGAGGMGTVYLAERSDGEFEQRVAIKQLAYPTPGLLLRFRQERQILAKLDHPNIAHLIDGGVDARGAPYFVMEYVDGIPITQYARTHSLDLRSRLELLLRICAAVQFAHQNLVVHRDLKPSNILVTADGSPKLLDFGIAKVLATTDADAATQTAARMLTPDYAAPEQFRGEPVTTATDVYVMGVVLYELLTDTRPRPMRTGAAAPDSRLGTLEIAPPSSVLDQATQGAAARRRALRGDLDRIVLKALASEPQRRYASAEGFAADIQRYLDGRPIAARADSSSYILRKFIKRNRISVLAAAIVLVTILAGTAAALWEAHEAKLQAKRAEQESRTSDAVKTFLVGIFKAASPDETLGKKVTAIDLLDAGRKRVATDLRDQPRVQAELFGTLAKIYEQLGQFKSARDIAQQGLDLVQGQLNPDDIAVLRLELVGAEVKDEEDPAQLQRSIARVEHVITVERALPPEQQDLLLPALEKRGEMERGAGHYPQSEALLREAVAIARQRNSSNKTDLVVALTDLGTMLKHATHFSEAEATYREALAIAGPSMDPHSLDMMNLKSLLADNLQITGNHVEAQSIFRDVLAAETDVLSKDHPNRAGTLLSLAQSLTKTGNFAEAEKFTAEGIAILKNAYGADAEPVGPGLGTLANIKFYEGDVAAAGDLERQALSILAKYHEPTQLNMMLMRHNMAVMELQAGKLEQARLDFEDVLRLRKTAHSELAPELIYIGSIERLQGHAQDARRIHADALADAEAHNAAVSNMTWYAHLALARDERDLGDTKAARADADFVASTAEKAASSKSPEWLSANLINAQIDYLEGHCDHALPILQSLQPLGDSMRSFWRAADVDLMLGLCERKVRGPFKEPPEVLIARSAKAYAQMPLVDPFYASLLAKDARFAQLKPTALLPH